jgi:hypothetical protein
LAPVFSFNRGTIAYFIDSSDLGDYSSIENPNTTIYIFIQIFLLNLGMKSTKNFEAPLTLVALAIMEDNSYNLVEDITTSWVLSPYIKAA